jgi:hypothetical protein
MRHADPAVHDEFQPRLEGALRYALAIGATLVLLLPGARGFSDVVGWLPLWLLAMPAVALWALRGFPLPRGAGTAAAAERRRRRGPQARRRSRRPVQRTLAQVA